MNLMIAAAGTGGHIYPALAVALDCQKLNANIHWIGTQKGMESNIVPNSKIPFSCINFSGVRHKGTLRWLIMPWQLLKATQQAIKILKKHQTQVVLVMGGYVSVPVTLAALVSRKKIIVHEQNSISGLANRLCSLFAHTVCQAFPNAFATSYLRFFFNNKIMTTGNPIRESILQINKPVTKIQQALNVLIIGGSLGSKSINKNLPVAMHLLSQQYPNKSLKITHQCGKNNFNTVNDHYQGYNLTTNVIEFIDDIEKEYQKANLIIARSGAMSVSEIEWLAIPALFIPYPYAVNDHQYHNAIYLQNKGQAEVLKDNDLSPKKCLIKLNQLITKDSKKPSQTQSKKSATQRITEICLQAIS